MEYKWDMTYKTNHGNIIDLDTTLLNTEENCYVGNYEIIFTFLNNDLGYYLYYHKTILFNNGNDYIEIVIDDNLVEPEIEAYWNKSMLDDIVNNVKDECDLYKVNYILDKMDNFNEYVYEKYKGLEEIIKGRLA